MCCNFVPGVVNTVSHIIAKQEAPAELIKTADEMIIKNFDVEYEEENPDIRMLGGIESIGKGGSVFLGLWLDLRGVLACLRTS